MSPRAPIQELGGGGERGKERERERGGRGRGREKGRDGGEEMMIM